MQKMISASLAGMLVTAVGAAGLPSDTPFTEATARQRAELILRKYLADTKMDRSELAEPFIELHDGDALVDPGCGLRNRGVYPGGSFPRIKGHWSGCFSPHAYASQAKGSAFFFPGICG